MSDAPDSHWHLDKKVPLALIIALMLQTASFAWWASDINGRVNNLERRAEATAPQADRLTRVEVKIESVQEGITEIKRLIRRETP
jgi:hypothetical protein